MLLLILATIFVPIILAGLAFDTVGSARRQGGQPGFTPTYRAYGA